MKTLTVKEMIVKTMAAGITVTIGVKPLVMEKMRIREPSMKIIFMMRWTIMMKTEKLMKKLLGETMMSIPMGALRIGVALWMLVQNRAPDMISMVGRFSSSIHFIIQSLAH